MKYEKNGVCNELFSILLDALRNSKQRVFERTYFKIDVR